MKTRLSFAAIIATVTAVISAIVISGCSPTDNFGFGGSEGDTNQSEGGSADNGTIPDYTPDLTIPADEIPAVTTAASVEVVFAGDVATVTHSETGISVVRSDADIILTSTAPNIEYRVSGTTTDGSVKIYSDQPFSLTLVGAQITNPSGPAINIQSKQTCFVTFAEGTTNTLTDSASYVANADGEDQKGTLFSEGALVFDGTGSLTIDAKYKHAIASDTFVVVRGGAITTTSGAKKGHSIASNGNITIAGGTLSLTAKGAAAKGLNAGGYAVITGGDTSITTSGDAIVEDNDTTSPSGIKADAGFVMNGGSLTVEASGKGGKAISTDVDFRLLGGTLSATTTGAEFVQGALDTSPKAIKADRDIYIKDGACTVTTTSEGLEAEYNIVIDGGTVDITAVDDAINASADRTAAIIINGGKVYAYSSANDGIDSNGTFAMTGGIVIASGTGQPEGGVDCDQNAFVVRGGTLISTGGATSYPTAGSQHSIVYGASGSQNDWIQVRKTGGDQVFVYRLPRGYGSQMVMLLSDGGIARSTGYTVTRGGSYSGGSETFRGLWSGGTYTGGTATSGTTSKNTAYTRLGNTTGGPGGRP